MHNPTDALARCEEAEELHRRWNDQWQRCGYGYRVVRRHGSDQQLGFCGIKPMDPHGRQVHGLFYRFATSARGQGLAGEAASRVTAWVSLARVRPATSLPNTRRSGSD
ncbi:GNAT family N-acetyltransferase [Streptomyces peucetius]